MIKAIIFDLDGVISDTEELQSSVEVGILKKHGIEMSSGEITEKYAGVSEKEWMEKVLDDCGVSIDISTVVKEKWDRLMSLPKNSILPIAGAPGLINELKSQKFKLGVASASIMKFIEHVLSELQLKDKFDAITSAEEVEFGKPNPAVFLLAAERLRVQPEECVVIEDGINGMKAAKKAGMKCIGLVSKNGASRTYPADLVVNSLKELTVDQIRRL